MTMKLEAGSMESGLPIPRRGVTPTSNEAQGDHIIRVDKGGTRNQSNLELRTRANNRTSSNKSSREKVSNLNGYDGLDFNVRDARSTPGTLRRSRGR